MTVMPPALQIPPPETCFLVSAGEFVFAYQEFRAGENETEVGGHCLSFARNGEVLGRVDAFCSPGGTAIFRAWIQRVDDVVLYDLPNASQGMSPLQYVLLMLENRQTFWLALSAPYGGYISGSTARDGDRTQALEKILAYHASPQAEGELYSAPIPWQDFVAQHEDP